MVMTILETFNLLHICVILHEQSESSVLHLNTAVALAALVWAFGIVLDCVQLLGYLHADMLFHVLASGVAWFNRCVRLLTGGVILATFKLGLRGVDDFRYCTALGMILFLKWVRVLMALQQIKAVGLRVLPITNTMLHVGPFFIVLAFYLMASTTGYYASGRYDFFDSFYILFKLAVLGEVEDGEFEGVFSPKMHIVNGNFVQQSKADRTDYYFIIRIFVVFISFLINVSMMNLFIAILCVSYAHAREKAEQAFVRSRAHTVLDLHAIRQGLRALQSLCRCNCKARRHGQEEKPVSRASLSAVEFESQAEQGEHCYMWVCHPRARADA